MLLVQDLFDRCSAAHDPDHQRRWLPRQYLAKREKKKGIAPLRSTLKYFYDKQSKQKKKKKHLKIKLELRVDGRLLQDRIEIPNACS